MKTLMHNLLSVINCSSYMITALDEPKYILQQKSGFEFEQKGIDDLHFHQHTGSSTDVVIFYKAKKTTQSHYTHENAAHLHSHYHRLLFSN